MLRPLLKWVSTRGNARWRFPAARLVTILTSYEAPEISVYAIYPETRHLSVKVRVFIDFLVERFGGRPYWDLAE